MAKKKDFNVEAVRKQIQDLDNKILKLTLVKQQLELSLRINQEQESSNNTDSTN